MRKVLTVLVLLVVSAALFASGQKEAVEKAAGPKKVVAMGPMAPPYRVEVLDAIIAQFEKENPNIDIEWRNASSWPDSEAKALTAIAGGDAPEILWQWITSFPTFSEKGLLEDLDPYVSKDPNLSWDMLFDGMVAASVYNGKHYGIPNDSLTAVTFYNKKLFAQAGVTAPPKTLDELRDTGMKIKNLGSDIYGFATFSKVKRTSDEWILDYLYPMGGDVMNKDNTAPAFNNDIGVQALQMGVDNIHKHKFAAPLGTQADELWSKGKVGMVTFWPWLVGYTEQYAPNMDYACTPVPGKETAGGPHIMTIIKASKNKDEAYKFLSFLFRKDMDEKWHVDCLFIPTTKYAMGLEYFQKHPAWKVFGQQLERMKPFPVTPHFLEAAEILTEELEGAYMQSKTPKQALDDAAKKLKDKM